MSAITPLKLPDFLQETDGDYHFTGTRISLPEFLHFYNALGYSAEMLALEYPSLDLAVVHKFIGFYLEHTQEVDSLVAAQQVALDARRAASPNHISLAALRKRRAASSQSKSA